MAMTLMSIVRRTTPHQPRPGLRARWHAFRLRYFRRARPVTDSHRHAWGNPALEAAFAELAAGHPEAVTPADGGTLARDADREQLLLATCDAWFREAHGPEHRWDARTVATYNRLMVSVRGCFHPAGGAR